jgi:hypothetical protein
LQVQDRMLDGAVFLFHWVEGPLCLIVECIWDIAMNGEQNHFLISIIRGDYLSQLFLSFLGCLVAFRTFH